jgi:AraC family transcriptional regulator
MQKKTVLIAVDGKQQEVYARLLLPDESVEFCSLPEALLNGAGADLLILDCGPDGEAGLACLKVIKERHIGLPVIFVTTASSEELVMHAFKMGARDYYKYPVALRDLGATVCRLLGLKRGCTPLFPVACDAFPANLLRTVRYMEDNLSDTIHLETLASQACMSKYHFCRVFKRHVGMSPMHCLVVMRVEQAKELLNREGVSVSMAAYRSGFDDLSEFNKQFKKVTGLTPSDYRKSNRGQK